MAPNVSERMLPILSRRSNEGKPYGRICAFAQTPMPRDALTEPPSPLPKAQRSRIRLELAIEHWEPAKAGGATPVKNSTIPNSCVSLNPNCEASTTR